MGFSACWFLKGLDKNEWPLHSKSGKPFGIQLWSVRQDMAMDPKGTLRALSQYGYTQIETFGDGDPMNMFWSMGPREFGNYLGGLGLQVVSGHCDAAYTYDMSRREEFIKLAADASSIGMKYLINPFMVQLKSIEAFKKAADQFNKQGEICKKAGLRFGYHNHNYSFRKIDGIFPQDILMEYTDPALVDFEMDIYWVVDAGQDPVEWIKKYPGRFRLCNLKDHFSDAITAELIKKEKPDEPELGLNVSCDLGKGKIDFKPILQAAASSGMKYYFIEQERYTGSTALESARKNAAFLKNML